MIPGMNTDVRYKGKTFHIQTEDSGPENPVLITHVFLGGTILGTERQNYAETLEAARGEAELEERVRELMKTQHRAMYKALNAGKFDDAARRPPRAKPPKGSIPLAKKRKGIMTGRSPRTTGSLPPASRPSAPIASTPPAIKTEPVPLLDVTEEEEQITELSVLDLQPAEPRLAFPTALTGAQPLSDLALAYLIEEPNET